MNLSEVTRVKVKMYAIFDSAAQAYLSPFCALSDGVARRMFEQAARDPQSTISRYPADNTLFRIGSYDDERAMLECEPNGNEVICNALEVLAVKNVDAQKEVL